MTRRTAWLSIAAVMLSALMAMAQDRPFTSDLHKKANVACTGCHGEGDPKAEGTEKACLTCHKSLEAVAERTKNLDKNPHQNHLTEGSDVECTQCHRGHKADDIICERCHSGIKFEKTK